MRAGRSATTIAGTALRRPRHLDPDEEYPSDDAMSVKIWATGASP